MVKQRIWRVLNWTLRLGGGSLMRTALRIGRQSALDTALGVASNAMPAAADRLYTQVFNVTKPITVYLRASHCRVTVRPTTESRVRLEANLQRVFGVEFATEQDDAGIYIVARRKPVVGTVSRAEFTLTVPSNAHLALHLTPGDIVFESVDGVVELPPTLLFPPEKTQVSKDS
jgi:hypothetical protein